ncbi:MAG: hypothetical protein F4110_12755 [Acidimicrobiaceae bacterium]|nr:hypothetical protein [Acidimicrobiaceae bacterium]MXZ99504.1 hypothetical protein [Acidimicrobiaceae bacterium]MYE75771.1 hypothetical protein [Acidimicrobiaceae bacterium]MYH44777.1 hypothetical protein [Acidimicrobiaceae bacterium]MYI54827.1 hypothetical protein [Acidimicrobiaceae bacterium]
MVELEAATLLVGWAAGGWFFLWVTTRRREVGLGYGWLMRSIFLALAAGSLILGAIDASPWSDEWATMARNVATAGLLGAGAMTLVQSIRLRSAGVAVQRAEVQRRSARVAEMTGIDRAETRFDPDVPEFPPVLDLYTAAVALAATVFGALAASGPTGLALARTLVGALFVGAVTSAMLLGHWYLVQPGLSRGPLLEMLRAAAVLWVPSVAVLLWPTGMVSVLNGTIDDGYNGLLGWFWVGCTALTILLVGVARAALRERQYSAVMAATGLVYLAIVTAFGQDLVARILLAP